MENYRWQKLKLPFHSECITDCIYGFYRNLLVTSMNFLTACYSAYLVALVVSTSGHF